MVCCEDGIEIDGLSCQKGKPLFFRELWAFGRVGEASLRCFEVDGVVLDELEGSLQIGMEECPANLSNRVPRETTIR